MSQFRWRVAGALLTVAFFAFLTLANLVPEETRVASPLLPDKGLRLGLDLQGGIHWVLGVKLEEAEAQELGFLAENLREIADAKGDFHVSSSALENGKLVVRPASDGDRDGVRSWAKRAGLTSVSDDGGALSYELSNAARSAVRKRGMAQVLEVLRRRIADPVRGIPDSVVTGQGEGRVLVQIPGGQIDRTRARNLLAVTGHLEFKIVKDQADNEELLKAKYPEGLPPGTKIATERDKATDRVLRAYLMPEQANITGDYLQDARVSFDRQQRPIVEFQFNSEGGRIFGDLTNDHIANIKSRIGSRGQIEGRFTSQEAADLAVVLRSGSLPIPVGIEEERTVGPALGADSISRGLHAAALGLVVIVVFVVVYYKLSGVYAAAALIANLFLLMGVMSLFEATLTLPGIAGIVLTIGMAVDANVIIFERIREELRGGKTPRAAIATGFNKAFWTIMDANVTTLITALVLFEYGTGPIKGFAVTLSVGVITSVFAALVFTRLMYQAYPGARPVASLSI
ncbi:MAG: protein translocase subunit SecD [Deltaproteobacteria bacterium]|nr:MAG: protein translocase subunit SecD [Deltaproteobacteria bacterium]